MSVTRSFRGFVGVAKRLSRRGRGNLLAHVRLEPIGSADLRLQARPASSALARPSPATSRVRNQFSAVARSASVAPAGSITIESGLIPARYASRKKSLMPFASRLAGFTRTSSSRSRAASRAVVERYARPHPRCQVGGNAEARAAAFERRDQSGRIAAALNRDADVELGRPARRARRDLWTGSDDEQWRIEVARELEDLPAGRGVGRQRRDAVGKHLLIQLAKTADHRAPLAGLQTGIEQLRDLGADLLRVGQLDVRHAR